MDSMIMKVTTILTAVSIIALLALLYVYFNSLRKMKSSFTLGLFIFALLFLIQNIVSFYYFATMMDYYAAEVEVHVFILTLLQLGGFLTLLKITWE